MASAANPEDAAYLAGMGVGLYGEDLLSADRLKMVYEPKMDEDTRKRKFDGWHEAVKKA